MTHLDVLPTLVLLASGIAYPAIRRAIERKNRRADRHRRLFQHYGRIL